MNNNLEEAKTRLQYPFEDPSAEWDYVESLLQKFESERSQLLTWVFEQSMAYWDTRVRAGIILLQENPSEAWRIIQSLVASVKPDDNGTVLTLFESTGDPRGLELAQGWLKEGVHPSIQLAASEFLKNTYPERVWSRVQALCDHEDPNIRKAAKGLADELKAS